MLSTEAVQVKPLKTYVAKIFVWLAPNTWFCYFNHWTCHSLCQLTIKHIESFGTFEQYSHGTIPRMLWFQIKSTTTAWKTPEPNQISDFWLMIVGRRASAFPVWITSTPGVFITAKRLAPEMQHHFSPGPISECRAFDAHPHSDDFEVIFNPPRWLHLRHNVLDAISTGIFHGV